MARFTDDQIRLLARPIPPDRVERDGKGHAHVQSWDVQRWLSRIFGFGGWSSRVVSSDFVAQWSAEVIPNEGKPNEGKPYTAHWVVYRAVVRLELMNPAGELVCVHEDGATGAAEKQRSVADAHDLALKSAISQAEKRAARKLGDQFGLSLYSEQVRKAVACRKMPPAVVAWDAAHGVKADGPVHDTVDTAGESEPETTVAEERPVEPAPVAAAGPDTTDPADSAPAAEPPLSDHERMTRAVQAFFSKVGYARPERLRAMGILAGRSGPIASSSELTEPELRAVYDRCRNFQRARDAAQALAGWIAQAEEQRALTEPELRAVAADAPGDVQADARAATSPVDAAADAIAAARTVAELHAIRQRIQGSVAQGRISNDDARILRQGWDQRMTEITGQGAAA